jgi:hypothetical protein
VIIGFDLDGVIAKRPRIFKLNHVKGRYRTNLSVWEQWFWRIVMWIREPSKRMVEKLKSHKENGDKVILISGRLSFLEDLTLWWLNRYNLRKYFDDVIINLENTQPHIYKANKIKSENVKVFYEDELFAAEYLKGNTKAKILLVIANGEIIKEL